MRVCVVTIMHVAIFSQAMEYVSITPCVDEAMGYTWAPPWCAKGKRLERVARHGVKRLVKRLKVKVHPYIRCHMRPMTTAGVDYSYCRMMVFEEIAVLATQEYLDTKRSAAARPVARPFAAPPAPPPPPPPMSLELPLVQSLELDPLLPLKTDDAELEKVALCTALARCTSAAMQKRGDAELEKVALCTSLARSGREMDMMMYLESCSSSRARGQQGSSCTYGAPCTSGALQVRGDDPPKGLQSSDMMM